MRPGIGGTRGAVDVFDYVASDPKTAIKTQKHSDGSADYKESIGRMGLMVGASAQGAASLAAGGGEAEAYTRPLYSST